MVKFSFCGGNDAPDWLLSEITLLSRLSSVRVKLLAIQVINELLGGSIDYDKIPKLVGKFDFSDSDIRASLAALTFIFRCAAQFDVSHETLSSELQQLGLPVETSGSLSRSFRDKGTLIKSELAQYSLRLPKLENFKYRLDSVFPSGMDISVLFQTNEGTPLPITLDQVQVRELLSELKVVKGEMNRILESL
ncbi:hypothetical protein P9112_011127 [Eukaryota sp. TZLM1-RC]